MSFFTSLFSLLGLGQQSQPQSFDRQQADLILYAPVSGSLLKLDHVPDPVVSTKIAGDGVAIAPVSDEVLAPCDGMITNILSSSRAFSLRHDSGLEIYVMAGTGAARYQGGGFTALASPGEHVKCGQKILHLDIDLAAQNMQTLITSVIVLKNNVTQFLVDQAIGEAEAGRTPILWIIRRDSQSIAAAQHSS